MNAVGSLTSDGPKDHNGCGYALFALHVLRGEADSHCAGGTVVWRAAKTQAVDACMPFAQALVRALGPTPNHSESYSANQELLRSGKAVAAQHM